MSDNNFPGFQSLHYGFLFVHPSADDKRKRKLLPIPENKNARVNNTQATKDLNATFPLLDKGVILFVVGVRQHSPYQVHLALVINPWFH